jgi:hypothetical protein
MISTLTELPGSSGNACDLYLEDDCFECQLLLQIFWLQFFLWQMPVYYLWSGHDHFLQFITREIILRFNTVWSDSIVK